MRRQSNLPTSSDLWASDGCGDEWRCLVPGSDVRVVTSAGRAIEAHSSVLAAASPVVEARLFNRAPKRHHNGSAILPIPGVPCDAVLAFLRCLYHGKITTWPLDTDTITANNNKHAVHLLVLSHAMRVPWLKRAAESALAATLQAEDVADLLQLARLCDGPRLKVRCLNYVRKDPAAVEVTEGWRFLRKWDPRMEAEVAQFVKEAERREERRRRRREENRAYIDLGGAVECLHHILLEGCGGVRPKAFHGAAGNRQPTKGWDDNVTCCQWQQTCEGLRALIRHFATCQQRRSCVAGAGCRRCGHMVQLLRLHAAISYELDHPMPPPLSSVCTPKTGVEEEANNNLKWRLLARKVVSAKLMSLIILSKRKIQVADHGQGRPPNAKQWKNQIET